MADFIAKPTNKKPVSDQSKNYEKNFEKTTTMHGLNLNEVDGLLTEKEMSLKKKIFSLPKMEALVHPDPKLSAVYNKMAEDGEEKYGYHYNETIMNIIFNDYVLNSPKYLQKYKMAVPKKKKRRDKSGIRQLQKAAEKKIEKSKKDDKKKKDEKSKKDDKKKKDVKEDAYSDTGVPAKRNEPMIHGGEVVDTGTGEGLNGTDKKLRNAKTKTVDTITKPPKAPKSHTNVNDMDETTSAGGGGAFSGAGATGSGGVADYTFAGPAAFKKNGGDLLEDNSLDMIKKPIWHGGTVISESNYLVESDGFEKYFNELNEVSLQDTVEYHSERQGENPFELGGVKWQFVNAKYPDGKVDIGVYRFDHDLTYDYLKWRESMNINENEMNEHHLTSDEDKVMYVIKANDTINPDKAFNGSTLPYIKNHFMSLGSEQIDALYRTSERLLQQKGVDPMSIDINESSVNEHHLNDRQSQLDWMIAADEKLNDGKNIRYLTGFLKSPTVSDEEINQLYLTYEKMANTMGIDPMDIKSTEKIDVNENDDSVFTPHGAYTVSNTGGYEIMLSNDGDAAKVRDAFGSDNPKISDWLEIEYLPDEETGELEPVIDPNGYNIPLNQVMRVNEETDQTMIGGNQESMANKPRPEGEFGGGVPMGMQDGGGIRESEIDDINLDTDLDAEQDPNKIDWERAKSIDRKPIQQDKFTSPIDGTEMFENSDPADRLKSIPVKADIGRNVKSPTKSGDPATYGDKNTLKDKFTSPIDGSEMFEQLNEELEAFAIHHNKLKSIVENKKHPSMVNLERKRGENQSNTKSDMKNSPVNDVIKMEKDIMWKDQQTDVGKNPYKAGKDLEKDALKKTKGDALKNVGNSDGTKGEIPKRNLTTQEQEEVDLYRLGQQDIVYDNQPDEKFEERMKAGMGEDMYKKREENLKKRAERPLYNKEAQPIQDTAVDKVQFNKEKSGWNDREGLKESVLAGKYFNELNKRKVIDFNVSDVKIVESVKNMFPIDFTGMGNSIDSRGNVNEAIDRLIIGHKFYTDGKNVVAMKNPVQNLNEGEKKSKPVMNEQFGKMKHLLGYDPKKYVDAKRSKI